MDATSAVLDAKPPDVSNDVEDESVLRRGFASPVTPTTTSERAAAARRHLCAICRWARAGERTGTGRRPPAHTGTTATTNFAPSRLHTQKNSFLPRNNHDGRSPSTGSALHEGRHLATRAPITMPTPISAALARRSPSLPPRTEVQVSRCCASCTTMKCGWEP